MNDQFRTCCSSAMLDHLFRLLLVRPLQWEQTQSKVTLTCLETFEQGAVGTTNLHLAPNGIYQDLDVGLYHEIEDHISD